VVDAGMPDAGMPDAGLPDAGDLDGGPLDAGALDAGTDAGVVDAGPLTAPACVPRETVCDNMIDDDLDGLTDCADPDCAGLGCGAGKMCVMGSCQ
jgi:hypothetical protein